ncbi:MAG: response regulator transcription factor [Candidatus Delongbacteria bacterium]|jgi:two-component system phosphate regulon response regulator OmpR|nr:response regulator transcription factor [Candidatus Delongbacteria bacterium]
MNIKALVVDDDKELQNLLHQYFSSYGIDTIKHPDGLNVPERISEVKPDIIILDYMLPGKEGFEVLKDIRNTGNNIPVIMLTARGDEMDRILGLELGADDYISKPFNPREIVARIKAVLRRNSSTETKENDTDEIIVDGVKLESSTYRLLKEDKFEELSLTEFKIIKVLMSRPGIIFSRDELMNYARGRDAAAFDRSIDMHISKLRNKLVSIGDDKDRIKTSWGSGYMFKKKVNQ